MAREAVDFKYEAAVIDRLKSVLVLAVLYIAGALAASWLQIGIPGAVIGLVFCLAAMIAAPALQDVIRPGALIMLALVPLFLVPLLARMALVLDFTAPSTWMIVGVVAVSSMCGVVLTGLIAKWLLRPQEEA
jgi:putative effector of murein hydrolase LrgA (UPF0299 family)